MASETARQKAAEFFNFFNNTVVPPRSEGYEAIWQDNLNYYNSEADDADIVGANNLFVPKTKAMVDAWLANNFANPPKTKAIPRNETGIQIASTVSQLESYAYGKPRNRRALWDVGWHIAVFGTGIAYISWRRTVKRVRVRDKIVLENSGYEEDVQLETIRTTEDYPDMECVSIWDFWPDPKASYIEDMRFVYRRRVYSDADSLDAYLKFFNAKLPKGVSFDDLTTASQAGSGSVSVSQTMNIGRFYTQGKGEVEVYERWNSDGTLQIVAGQYMVYDGDSPFDHADIPFAVATIHRNSMEFYGRGIPEIYKPIQDALNKELNVTLDNLEIASYPMIITRSNSRISAYASLFELGPGAIIEDDNPQEVNQLRLQSMSFDHFNMFSMLERLGSESVSITSPMMGQTAPGTSKTATGITAMIDMGLAPSRLSQQMFDVLFIRRVSRLFYSLFQQYMPEDYIIAIVDDSESARVVKVQRSELMSDFDFEPQAGAMNFVDKSTQRQTWLTLFQISSQVQQAMLSTTGKKIELDKVFAQLLDAFGVKNQKEFVQEDKEFLMQAQQQAEQMKQQQALQQMAPQGIMPQGGQV